MDINDIVDSLIEVTAKILMYKAGVALGEEPPENSHKYQKQEMSEILKLATPLIQNAQVSRSLNAQSSQEVIQLLSGGKITPNEAVALLKLVKERVEVESKEMEHKLKQEIMDN